ncbi:MAG TPA: hypothetical protein VJN63_09850 [Thermoplasmata archaeon]|nr:hypothetical protein [Thermoplasmata archaeon]
MPPEAATLNAPPAAVAGDPVQKPETSPAAGTAPKPADAPPAGTPDPKSTAPDASPGATPGTPAVYALKIPDGSLLAQADIDSISAWAKERGYTNEEAQEIVGREHETSLRVIESLKTQHEREQQAWVDSVKADPELGGDKLSTTRDLAGKVLRRFGSDKLAEDVKRTGLGNYPEFVRLLARIGRAISEDTLATGSIPAPGGRKSDAEAFYPTPE